MIQVTHLKGLPRTIDYWDYYILCRCVKHAGSVLQRMEYWDGTKANGNIHAEQINEQLKEAGKQPTQDTSRFVYKSREELAWEMLDACKERVTYDLLDYLSNTLHFLNTRRNPYKAFDRTLQYEFQYLLVQDRLNQLNAIIKHFIALGRQMRPVLFAIEQLTLEGYYIHRVEKDGVLDGKGDLTIEEVAKKLRAMHEQVEKDNEECKQPIIKGEKRYKPALPYFIRADMGRDEQLGFSKESDIPLCKSAQSSVQENTMDCADVHDALCNSAQAIPVITTSNNNSGNDTVRGTNAHVSDDNARTPSLSLTNSPSSLQFANEGGLHIQQGRQVGKNGVTSVTAQEIMDAQQRTASSSLQESTEESTPAPSDEQSSKQESGSSDSQSAPNTTQDSTKQAPTEQPTLLARPEKPEMPPTSMRWSAEKLVQIVEAFLGAYYDELQRPDQIKAAQKILKRGVKEEPFVQGYCKRNDAWWHEKKGKLHVTHMAANTQRGQMRILEVLSEMGTSPTKEIKQATNTAAALAESQARDEKNRASIEKMRQRKAALEAKRQGA